MVDKLLALLIRFAIIELRRPFVFLLFAHSSLSFVDSIARSL